MAISDSADRVTLNDVMIRQGKGTVVYLAAIAVGLILGAQVVRMRVAEAAVRNGDGGTASALRPQNGFGLALAAEERHQAGRSVEAIALSRRAVDASPLAVVGLRTFARAQDKIRGPGSGEKAWQASSMLGWRDKHTQLWAAQRALVNGEAEIFAMRSDALLRTGEPSERLMAFVRQAVAEPRIRAAFIPRIVARPPWRLRFFHAERPPTGAALNGVVAVLHALAHTPALPNRRELRDSIAGLVAEKRFAEAVALDRRFISRSSDPGSLIGDGQFEAGRSDYLTNATPFDWTIDPRVAALDNSDRGRSIVILSGSASSHPALGRLVPLPPGDYALLYNLKADASAANTIRVRTQCASSGAEITGEAPASTSQGAWQEQRLNFTVPAGCGLVNIAILRAGKLEEDVFIDDAAVRRARS